MNKKAIATLAGTIAIVVIMMIAFGLSGNLSNTKAMSDGAQQPEGIKVMGEDGSIVEILPMVAKRDGEPRTVDSFGIHTLKRLGYSDIVFPCKERLEAVSLDYFLPEDAAQGLENWYVLNLNLLIEFSEQSQDGLVEVSATTNEATCTSFIFESKRLEGSLVIDWGRSRTGLQSASSPALNISCSDYLKHAYLLFNGVKPGHNTLTIRLLQYQGAEVKSMRIFGNSSIEHTTSLPPGVKERAPEDLPKLPEEEELEAERIAMSDPRVQELIEGKEYVIDLIAPCDWGSSGDARVDIRFKVPHQIEYDWPWPPVPIREKPLSGNFWIRVITVAIDLEGETVLGISPVGQPLAGESLPGPEIPRLTEEEKARAKEIALSDPRVNQLIAGKSYEVARKYGGSTPDTRIGIWHTSKELIKIGAGLEVWFDKSSTIEYDWPTLEYDEEKYTYPHYQERTISQEFSVRGLLISINLAEGRVVGITPLTAEIN